MPGSQAQRGIGSHRRLRLHQGSDACHPAQAMQDTCITSQAGTKAMIRVVQVNGLFLSQRAPAHHRFNRNAKLKTILSIRTEITRHKSASWNAQSQQR